MTNYDETRPDEMGAMPEPKQDRVVARAEFLTSRYGRKPYELPAPTPRPGEFYGDVDWDDLESAAKFVDEFNPNTMRLGLRHLTDLCHGASLRAGWWQDENGEPLEQPYQVPIKLALVHSEISEALEADRKGLRDDKLPHRWGIEVELADAVIRIFDLAGVLGLDLAQAIIEKSNYNAHREDHKPGNRMQFGGKAY